MLPIFSVTGSIYSVYCLVVGMGRIYILTYNSHCILGLVGMETRYVRLIENFPFQDNLDNAYNVAQSLSLQIWALCTGVSMYTSKLLLVDMNLHYPLHLHLLQLAIATLLVLVFSSPRHQYTRLPTFTECTVIFGASCLMALSTGFNLQAILHFPNLTTLTMFSVGLRIRFLRF